MSNFDQIKHNYAIYYDFIGIRVRGKWNPICIFQEYWYGRRVLPLYYPYNPRSDAQQTNRNFFAYAVAYWQGFDDQTKNYYNQEAKRFYLYGYHRYLTHYLKANLP